jgi:hypothetical protein
MRAIAVDWSGALQTARSHIWLAEASHPGELDRLECGRDRDELRTHLLSLGQTALVIGLDFAFSFPSWFVHSLSTDTAPDLWARVAEQAEAWLSVCQPPFWGRPGYRRPPMAQASLRRTDLAVPRTAGVAPKSIFQIGGAGAVGTGSLRGMPLLHHLHQAGFRIWPFTAGGATPTVVEIYPRLLTGPVNKSNAQARAELVCRRFPDLSPSHRDLAVGSEDAFDAAVSALVMAEHVADMACLPDEADPDLRLEGRIWHPGWRDDCP